MAILVDSSAISTVVVCTCCPYWHAFTWTRAEGWLAGARHEAQVHPATRQARHAAENYLARHPT